MAARISNKFMVETSDYIIKVAAKVEQAERIKSQFEKRRLRLYDNILEGLELDKSVRELVNLNKREMRVMDICEKGITNLELVCEEVMDMLKSQKGFLSKRIGKDAFILKRYYKILIPTMNRMRKAIKAIKYRVRVEEDLLNTSSKYLKKGYPERTQKILMKEFKPIYENERKLIEKVNKNRAMKKLLSILERVSPRDAKIIIGSRVVPYRIALMAAATAVGGPPLAAIVALSTWFVSYAFTLGYSTYALKKSVGVRYA